MLLRQPSLERRSRGSRGALAPAGFTLVELLIVVSILLILLTMSVAVYSSMSSSDRIRSSARQVQSAFAGARDRAIKAGRGTAGARARRGLRLLVDATNPSIVTSFVYVGSEENWSDGVITVGRQDQAGPMGMGGPDGIADTAAIQTVRGWGTGWKALFDQGLLINGSRIRIPKNSGSWYTVNTSLLASYTGIGPEILLLNTESQRPATIPTGFYTAMMLGPNGPDGQPGIAATPGVSGDDDGNGSADNALEVGGPGSDDTTDINAYGNLPESYELELQPTVLPGVEPMKLSSGIAIKLYDRDSLGLPLAKIPTAWRNELSLTQGTALPAADTDGYGNINYWGAWTIEGPDPSVAGNDIYRQYSPHMDVMFSTGGSVVGPLSAAGTITFRLADIEDITLKRNPADPQAAPMLYSTLFTQTGFLATFPVDITDGNNDLVADDPLSFTRRGSTVGR